MYIMIILERFQCMLNVDYVFYDKEMQILKNIALEHHFINNITVKYASLSLKYIKAKKIKREKCCDKKAILLTAVTKFRTCIHTIRELKEILLLQIVIK